MAALNNRATLKSNVIRLRYNRSDTEALFDLVLELVEEALNIGHEDIPPLRVRQMIQTEDLVVTAGVASLPDDYLRYIEAADIGASPYRPLTFYSGTQSLLDYPDTSAGPGVTAAIRGTQLLVGPNTTSTVRLVYYGAVPPLTNEDDTNDVFDAYKTIYLRGCAFFAAEIQKDDDETMKQGKMFRSAVVGANRADTLANYSNASVSIGGLVV